MIHHITDLERAQAELIQQLSRARDVLAGRVEALEADLARMREQKPVAKVICTEEPRYERPPRSIFELIQLDGFRALPVGEHMLYAAPPAKPADGPVGPQEC